VTGADIFIKRVRIKNQDRLTGHRLTLATYFYACYTHFTVSEILYGSLNNRYSRSNTIEKTFFLYSLKNLTCFHTNLGLVCRKKN